MKDFFEFWWVEALDFEGFLRILVGGGLGFLRIFSNFGGSRPWLLKDFFEFWWVEALDFEGVL